MHGNDLDSRAGSRLPCGHLVDDLLAQVADGQPPADPEHQQRCPHCRAALSELDTLWQPVRVLVAEEVRAPANLLANVMARVRDLVEHGWYAVIRTSEGDTRIAARVIGALARLAAEEVPGVSLALGGGRTGDTATAAELAGDPGEAATNVGVAGTHVVVDVDVVVHMGTSVLQVSQKARERITDRIAGMTGLNTREVNITVVDVVQPNSAHF